MHDLAIGPGLRRPSRAIRLRSATRAIRLRSATLLLLGLAAPTGCDPDGDRSGPVHAGSAQASNDADRAALAPGEVEALRAEVTKSLRAELRPEVVAELRRELTPAVKAELLAELRREPRPATSDATADSEAAAPPVPTGPGEPSAEVKADDPWSQPGTRIWPSAGGLKLVELVVGTALEDKLPTDVKTHYPNPPEILYCYSVFENPEAEATVTHVWRRGSRLVSRVELEVGNSPKWRTWSKQRTQPHWTGLWSCEVLGSDGRQLGLTVFQIGG